MRLSGYALTSVLFAVQWIQPGEQWSLYAWFASVPLAILLDFALRSRSQVSALYAWMVRLVTTVPPVLTFTIYAVWTIRH